MDAPTASRRQEGPTREINSSAFLGSLPILMGRLRRRRDNSSGVRVRSIVSERIGTVAFGTHTVDALLLLVCGLRHQEEMGFCGHIERLEIS